MFKVTYTKFSGNYSITLEELGVIGAKELMNSNMQGVTDLYFKHFKNRFDVKLFRIEETLNTDYTLRVQITPTEELLKLIYRGLK